ncbi:sorting nexin-17-like isoform X1 [Limulus polyphemus]|uniref:Sorting nexin-17 n=1 Tax=Limulus polyphemus TaxID=6850 RepID=A0ABM1B7P7_LIMPO|nr:sorting nexin-17-like isoform X1 [Limulus polyphemus]
MHFSIPDTLELKDSNGGTYMGYNIHINGAYHCTIRYKQLHSFNEQLKKEYKSVRLPQFPPKKLLPLSPPQLEERRILLEKYIQTLSQDPDIGDCNIFRGFLLSAQQETQNATQANIDLDVYTMNWHKVTVRVNTTDATDTVLLEIAKEINLHEELLCYFCLYLVKKDGTDIKMERRLQNFEAPSLSLKAAGSSHCIVIRKSYWDSSYDEDLYIDKVALNLLYVQAVSDVELGWVITNKQIRRQLATLQSKGSKQEYMQLVRTLKHYGYIQFEPCVCNYPEPNTQVIISAGGKELNFRISNVSNQVKEGSFRITRIRCWRILTSNADKQQENNCPHLEFSFEYLLNKDKLQWITIESDQAVLMSVCLQGMVEELLSKKNGVKFKKQPEQGGRHCSWSYMKRDGSSYEISVSRSSSSEGIVDNEEEHSKRTNKTRDHVRKEKLYSAKQSGCSSSGSMSPESLMENDVFEGIGDDDL